MEGRDEGMEGGRQSCEVRRYRNGREGWWEVRRETDDNKEW